MLMHPVIVNVSIAASEPFPALCFNDRVMALAHWRAEGLRGTSSMSELLNDWAVNAERLQQLCRTTALRALIMERGVAVSALRLHAPVAPRQLYCTIGNYRAQALQAALDADSGGDESARRRSVLASIETRRNEGAPYVCLKGPAAVAGPFDSLPIEAGDGTLDWEVEIGVVIGRGARNVEAAHAFDYVAGYCVVNDITLRDQVIR
jgi:2,4-didehydro-3-deoxy-L-rhamnonate hydrolase